MALFFYLFVAGPNHISLAIVGGGGNVRNKKEKKGNLGVVCRQLSWPVAVAVFFRVSDSVSRFIGGRDMVQSEEVEGEFDPGGWWEGEGEREREKWHVGIKHRRQFP